VSPQTTRRHQTPTVRPATGQLGTDPAALRRRLDDAISDHGLKWTPDTAAAVERVLSDAALLDALIAYRLRDRATGFIVGYLDDDSEDEAEDGEVFRVWCEDLLTDRAVADRKLATARREHPEGMWALHAVIALTDITERPTE
jgi:hypothetical protein